MTKQVTIHHTAFWRADTGPAEYGKRTLVVNVRDGEPTAAAEQAFHDTNAPDAFPHELSRSGRCYSMSTGDVLEVEGFGGMLMCASVGFRAITRGQFVTLLGYMRKAHVENPDRHWTMDFDGLRLLGMLSPSAAEQDAFLDPRQFQTPQ